MVLTKNLVKTDTNQALMYKPNQRFSSGEDIGFYEKKHITTHNPHKLARYHHFIKAKMRLFQIYLL